MRVSTLIFFVCSVIFGTTNSFAQAPISVIPYPKEVKLTTGTLNVDKGIKFQIPERLRKVCELDLKTKLNYKLSSNGIPLTMTIMPGFAGNQESYNLDISTKGIRIQAKDESGLFYGFQTLVQLGMQYGKQLPLLHINDEPRFAWRAYMLDEGRYFQGKVAVLQLLDDMAMLKMNKFHWHLTDDAGWRIEIKKYPLLTTIGSVRDSSQINVDGKKWQSEKHDGKPHAGFYTQQDIQEIVAYAKDRHIQIVPEINMPGHASAAVASYPWLGTSKEKIKVPTRFGVVTTVFDVSDPRVVQFLHDVLTEVSLLFPGDVIHIGGDEVKFNQWEQSPAINAYMKANNLPEYSDLQVFFTNNMSMYIERVLGKRMMGWNEIMGIKTHDYQKTKDAKTELSKKALIHFWRGTPEALNTALDRGYQVINANHSDTYLDYTYMDIPLLKAYEFEPVPVGVDTQKSKNIIGLGCQMWGEWTPTFKEVTLQTFPRIAAFAETGWSAPENKNFERFKDNLPILMKYWSKKNYVLPNLNSLLNKQ